MRAFPSQHLRQKPGSCLIWLLASFALVAEAQTETERQSEVSFRNEVMAVLSKAGCNAGTCHGNKNGKGGFKLSLRGQDPEADYFTLTRDSLGLRANAVEPEQSLLLLKPTTQVAHEGGLRFKKGSNEYDLLRRWIGAGMPNDLASAPKLQRLLVSPSEKILLEPTNETQVQARAQFSDGTTRVVTSLAVYEPVGSVVKVSQDGLAQGEGHGEATVLVRYLHCQEPVRLVFVPARPGFVWSKPRPKNYIDEHIFRKLRTLRLNPSGLCSDAVFLRRAYLDLLGLLPGPEEARSFIASSRSDKRAVLVEALLNRAEFAEFWALKWADLLRVEAHSLDAKGVQAFHGWIRQSIAANKPLDQFVRELLTAQGSTYSVPAANYYRPLREPAARATAVAQVFLGARLRCAECHNHPSDRWTQDDYYDWAGLFARINYKVIENKREIGSDEHEWNGEQVVFVSHEGAVKNPRTGKDASPRFLGAPAQMGVSVPTDGKPGISPRGEEALAAWLTSPTNSLFARVQANRIWFHLMGRGLVDPPDDFRATNPASHPDLLDALARDLVEHGFNLRELIRRMMNSRAYQLASDPAGANGEDEINYSHATSRRLGAEQLLDCQSQAAGVPLRFAGYPLGLRAAQLPGVRPESKSKRAGNALDQFLETFGKPPRLLTTDAERSCECNIAQAFQMVSGPTVNELLAEKENRISRCLAAGKSNQEIVEELFWAALTRPPTAEERDRICRDLEAAKDRRAELEDVLWGLLTSAEFLFRR